MVSATPITVRESETDLYLMFTTRVVGETPYYNYGWVQLRVTPDDVSLIHSAINLDGDPIVVGVWDVPEPSSLLLLAAGGLSLSLKRRKFNAKCAKTMLDDGSVAVWNPEINKRIRSPLTRLT